MLKLNVLLMHEDLAAGLRGKQALDQVGEKLGMKAEFSLHLWKFDLLNEPKLWKQALHDAHRANIVVLAIQGDSEPSPKVQTWLKQWLQSRVPVPCALVVSMERDASSLPFPPPALQCIRAIAEPFGVDLFPHYNFTPPVAWDWTTSNHESVSIPILMKGIPEFPKPSVAWGINE